MKPKVAILSLTGCAGCQLTIYFIKDILLNLLGKIDLVSAGMIKGKNSEGPYDLAFVEGLVAYQEDLNRLLEWRKKTKIMVALGTCATDANVPGIKNYTSRDGSEKAVYKNLEHLERGNLKKLEPRPIDAFVEVEYKLSGCPPDEAEIVKFIKDVLAGKKPRIYMEPVCAECTLKENDCLLDKGMECLGPLIRGGCNALCPTHNHSCTGCHGPIADANLSQGVEILIGKGFSMSLIKKRLVKYAGYNFERIFEEMNLRE